MGALKSADMVAVLNRTILKTNAEDCLLPIYEAISNAIYSTKEKWGDKVAEKGEVKVEISTSAYHVSVIDNGIGLNEENYESFTTPFTSYRLDRGGKGFGRFIAFKVFKNITYSSKYESQGQIGSRSFDFDIYSRGNEFKDASKNLTLNHKTGCIVFYQSLQEEMEPIFSGLKDIDIVVQTIRYFLPFHLSNDMPNLKIEVDNAIFDTREHFFELFDSQEPFEKNILLESGEHEFKIQLSKVNKESFFKNHALLLFADGRIIGAGRNIQDKIGVKHFINSNNKKQVYIASVSSEYLDTRANNSRTAIEASEKDIDEIVRTVCDEILKIEEAFVTKHREGQAKGVQKIILRNPILRTGLKQISIKDYVNKQPMSWDDEKFMANLAIGRYREQKNWLVEFEEGLTDIEKFKASREKIFSTISEENKNALATYIAHRSSILDLANSLSGYNESGEYEYEKEFHKLIYPQNSDSEVTKFYQNNLWMIDERLAFFHYCSSDRTIHGGKKKLGDKIADIALFENCFFDDCLINTLDNNHSSVVLIEFKRPGRDDYSFGNPKADPVEQVRETIRHIRKNNSVKSTSGNNINIPKGALAYAYIIADLSPSLHSICKQKHRMHQSWDNSGYYLYFDVEDEYIFIEVIPYSKLLNDAKKRNTAFFEILLGDISN